MALYTRQTDSSENITTIDFYNEQDQHIGYVKYRLEQDKMLLENVFIFKEFRGQGLSVPMFSALINAARENRAVCVEADIYPRESACLIGADDFSFFKKMKKLTRIFKANGFEVTENEEDAKGVLRL